MGLASVKSSMAATPWADGLADTLEKTGLLLPLLIVTIAVLAVVYNDRTIFSPPNRKEIYQAPNALPLIGHTYFMFRQGIKDHLEGFMQLCEDAPYGTWRITFFGGGSLVHFNRPEYLEYVQKTHFENFPKGRDFRDKLGDLLGVDGIFVADGDVWKKQRKAASHMFSARQFNNWVRVVVHSELNSIDELLDTVAKRKDLTVKSSKSTAGSAASGAGGAISMPELFFRYTLSSFAKMAFAADLGCLTSDPASLNQPVPFAVAFDSAQSMLNARFWTPGWSIAEAILPYGKRVRENIRVVKDFGMAIIEQRLSETDGRPIDKEKQRERAQQAGFKRTELQNDGKDLLAIFMESTRDPSALLTVVLNFIIAGRDTTAQTLSWLFYELCAHPEHVALIREEVDSELGRNAAAERSWLGYDDVKRLPYTLACIHEAARLHPPVPKNGKEVLKDDIIIPQGPGAHGLPPLKVYKGETVSWSDWGMNRCTDIWGPDAADYNPQRFLSRNEKGSWTYVQQSPWTFHVFNAGPRLCLGMNLANFEAVSFTAATLQKYDFTWTTPEQGQTGDWPPKYAESLTHPMKRPYECIVTARKS